MGYTHNWTTRLPQSMTSMVLGNICHDIVKCFGRRFGVQISPDTALTINHESGQAETLVIGKEDIADYSQSCKTGRGVAELDIAELLFRSAIAINDAGGHMELFSDWAACPTEMPLNGHASLTTDAAVSLSVLVHRCADLLVGRQLVIKDVPRAWGLRSPTMWDSASSLARLMHVQIPKKVGAIVFGIDKDGQPDYSVTRTPADKDFAELVTTHAIQGVEFDPAPKLRGLLYSDCVVWLDDKLLVGRPGLPLFIDHPEVVNRTHDLLSRVPGPDWVAGARQGRVEAA